ncbi:hypothetical protein IB234_15370 [Pseudomonas sp. PDM16]|uniref:hypothetical protein n=1 Tax=Pseudomonas sp. PDM16 TaxID=2769292 RepID=UPI001780E1C3|nr:hypothetical protein [Pseudomonas sp. PDM16]MBD9415942.1 hypothetical protein [Pseudomonas sp. PDM16]
MDDLLEILKRSFNGEYTVRLEERADMTIIRCHDKAGMVVASRSLTQEQKANRELAALVIDDLVLTVTPASLILLRPSVLLRSDVVPAPEGTDANPHHPTNHG